MIENLSGQQLGQVFRLLGGRLTRNEAPPVGIVVCGGAALIVTGLSSLRPTDEELSQAARWALTHDVSPGFRSLLKQLLETLGYGKVASTV